MSERLTDEQLNDYISRTGLDMPGMKGTVLEAIVTELKERRGADLKSFDLMVLEVWRDRLETDPTVDRAFIALLDRLTKAGR